MHSPHKHNQAPETNLQKNYNMLRRSELSGMLIDAYDTAMLLEPRLADIAITALPPDGKHFARAVPRWASPTGQHEMRIPLGAIDPTLHKFDKLLSQAFGARHLYAKLLSVKPHEVTPQLLFVTAALHELGHVDEYLDYEGREQELAQRNAQERAAMPAGRLGVSQLLAMNGDERMQVEEELRGHASHIGVSSFHNLVKKQHEAYRNLPGERNADRFAVDAFALNPVLLVALTDPDLNRYRTPYAAAGN